MSHCAFPAMTSRVSDGIRTRDRRDHNPDPQHELHHNYRLNRLQGRRAHIRTAAAPPFAGTDPARSSRPSVRWLMRRTVHGPARPLDPRPPSGLGPEKDLTRNSASQSPPQTGSSTATKPAHVQRSLGMARPRLELGTPRFSGMIGPVQRGGEPSSSPAAWPPPPANPLPRRRSSAQPSSPGRHGTPPRASPPRVGDTIGPRLDPIAPRDPTPHRPKTRQVAGTFSYRGDRI
jgi:hypothetical protein